MTMNVEDIREYCMNKKGVKESLPFDESTLVFKVGGKMFLLLDINSNPPEFNVKCEPGKAIELREKYDFIVPGYHMNKTHWNTVSCAPAASRKLILGQIDHSYELVFNSLPAKIRATLK
jgi:predicted DNA-binding protein (MmcQ/YjbR family)